QHGLGHGTAVDPHGHAAAVERPDRHPPGRTGPRPAHRPPPRPPVASPGGHAVRRGASGSRPVRRIRRARTAGPGRGVRLRARPAGKAPRPVLLVHVPFAVPRSILPTSGPLSRGPPTARPT